MRVVTTALTALSLGACASQPTTGGAAYLGYGITERTANVGVMHECLVARGYTPRPKG